MSEITENAKNHKKYKKITDHAKNHGKCLKSWKSWKNAQNCGKYQKSRKRPKIRKIPKILRAFQLPAQCPQLEVGAQKAPRLQLKEKYFYKKVSNTKKLIQLIGPICRCTQSSTTSSPSLFRLRSRVRSRRRSPSRTRRGTPASTSHLRAARSRRAEERWQCE